MNLYIFAFLNSLLLSGFAIIISLINSSKGYLKKNFSKMFFIFILFSLVSFIIKSIPIYISKKSVLGRNTLLTNIIISICYFILSLAVSLLFYSKTLTLEKEEKTFFYVLTINLFFAFIFEILSFVGYIMLIGNKEEDD